MLKALRNKKTRKNIFIFLAIIIIPAFAFWGLGGALRSKQESAYAGKIFGKNISFLEYKDALDAVKNTAIIQFGDNFAELQKQLNLEGQAWERLILLYEARKRRINVTNKEVIELIESYPFFQRKGQFDQRIYSELLRYAFRTQPRIFEEQTRQNLMLSKLYKQLTDNIKITEEETKEEYRRANEEISIYYIAGVPSDFTKDTTASDEELKDYFAKNALNFEQPLSFNLDYIVLESEDKIRNVASRINKKDSFEKIVKEMGLELKETGLFTQTDPIPGIGWTPEVLNLISKLKVGQFSPVIELDKYYYILRLKERKEAYIPDFEKVKETVREGFKKVRAQNLAKEKIEEAVKILKESYALNPNSVDFNKTAKVYGLKSDSTDLFKYGSYIEGIGASDNFWIASQKLKENEFSEVIDMGPAGFYIIKLKKRVPVDEKKFVSEKDAFTQKTLLQKKEEYFTQILEDLKRKAR